MTTPGSSKGSRPEVLVLEPLTTLGRSALSAVRELGFPVRHVVSAAAAWRALGDSGAGILIAGLAEAADLELCRRVRAGGFERYVYIVVLTPSGDPAPPYKALQAGADAQLPLPLDVERLRWVLHSAERILHFERELRGSNQKLRDANYRLARVARLDPLMQIGSRLAFEDKIREVHDWAVENDRFYALVMGDLDHFKCYNDTLGHQQGDEILRRVAQAVVEAIRVTDHAFRYGGEELALLLINRDLDDAAAVAERVRRQVEAVEFELEDGEMPFRVTISCGVSAFPENVAPGGDWRQVVEGADQALYIAKGTGRNRVAVMSGPGLQVLAQARGQLVVEDSAGGSGRLLRPAPKS